jgi:sugar phosphate isomerase/epimerase
MKIPEGGPPLGLAHFTVLEVPPAELVALAARTGYAFVGLRLHPAFPGAPCYAIPPGSETMREVRRRMAGEGVRVQDIEFVTVGEDFEPRGLLPVLEQAGELGAARLSCCGDDPDRARLVARFAELCDLAAGFGMGVDLECMAWRRVASFADAVGVVRAAGRPNGGALVDALHLARTGGSPTDLENVPLGLVRSAQLCDAPAARPSSEEAIIREARSGRLLPGEGDLPLCRLLAALPDDVAVSVEVPTGEDVGPPEARARRIREATRALFERCRRPAEQAPPRRW